MDFLGGVEVQGDELSGESIGRSLCRNRFEVFIIEK